MIIFSYNISSLQGSVTDGPCTVPAESGPSPTSNASLHIDTSETVEVTNSKPTHGPARGKTLYLDTSGMVKLKNSAPTPGPARGKTLHLDKSEMVKVKNSVPNLGHVHGKKLHLDVSETMQVKPSSSTPGTARGRKRKSVPENKQPKRKHTAKETTTEIESDSLSDITKYLFGEESEN